MNISRQMAAGLVAVALILTACRHDHPPVAAVLPDTVKPAPAVAVPVLKVGLLPDTQGGGFNVAQAPMRALLDYYQQQQVQVVLALGDLTENGTVAEYQQWRQVAAAYKGKMTILPIQGNHDIKGTDLDWYQAVHDLFPADVVHLPGQEWKTYYWLKDRVLFLNVSYGHMPYVLEFLRQGLQSNSGRFDHVLLATHNPLVGGRNGYIREMAVDAYESSAADQQFLTMHEALRQLLADHQVMYLAGHEHAYLRSQIAGKFGGYFTEIVAGNASFKGYDSRFGESELIQHQLMFKVNDPAATGMTDVNASIFQFQGKRVDYKSWFYSHRLKKNEDGPLPTPDWQLLDRFSYAADRCDKLVFPASIPAGNQLNMLHDKSYRTVECKSGQGLKLQIIDGENQIFNRYDSRNRSKTVTAGTSTAASNAALLARQFRWLNIEHAGYRPNLNNNQRLRLINAGTADEKIEIRATTIDLKKHLQLSFAGKHDKALSETFIISGIQGQDGTYMDAGGLLKAIDKVPGLPGSRGDGSEQAKLPLLLPSHKVTANFNLADDVAGDNFVLKITLPAEVKLTAGQFQLGRWQADKQQWQSLLAQGCVSQSSYQSGFLTSLPVDVAANCQTIAGVQDAESFWIRLQHDGDYAVLANP